MSEQPNSTQNNNKKNTRMLSTTVMVPAAAIAMFFVGMFVPGSGLLVASSNNPSETITPHGYVVVSAKHADGTEFYHNEEHNVITNAGKDFIAAQTGSTSPGANGANYIALTNTAITPSASHTTLSGEITTNGLARSQGTYAHTAGQNTYTVSETFTATGTQSAQAAGLFTASSAGTMLAENTFTSVTLASGDQLTVTWTITMS